MNHATPVIIVVALLATSGCIGVLGGLGPAEASAWNVDREPSMYPDFSREGHDSFPVLVVHKHEMSSKNQQQERRSQPGVVCLSLDGAAPLASFGPARGPVDEPEAPAADEMAMAPCMPAADPAAGRLFIDHGTFHSWGSRAVVLAGLTCPEAIPLSADEPGFRLPTLAHEFRVELLANDTFLIDGAWYLEPGEAFKITYTADYGHPDDARLVKAVFDYPGRWLESMVYPQQGWEPVPVHNRPCFLGDRLLEPVEDASLSLCCM